MSPSPTQNTGASASGVNSNGSRSDTFNLDINNQNPPWWQDIAKHVGNRVGDWLIGNLLPGGAGIPGFAKGGVITKPTLGMVGEGGKPEAIVPLRKAHKFYGE